MPKLLISLPDAGEVVHELSEANVSVGRVEDNVLPIDDVSVSSHHAEIAKRGDQYFLKDLNSTNGTFVNGQPLEGERALEAGDRIQFGKIEATFETEEGQRSKPLPREEAAVATPAETSQRPEDFSNASPFQRKRTQRNPASLVALAAAVIAALAFAASLFFAQSLQAPGL